MCTLFQFERKGGILLKTRPKTKKQHKTLLELSQLLSVQHKLKGANPEFKNAQNRKNRVRKANSQCEQWLEKNSKDKVTRKKVNSDLGEML